MIHQQPYHTEVVAFTENIEAKKNQQKRQICIQRNVFDSEFCIFNKFPFFEHSI